MAGCRMRGQNCTGDFAQAAFGTVARHRVADFFGTGKAHPNFGVFIAAIADLQDEPRSYDFLSARGTQEVRALFQYFKRQNRQRGDPFGGCVIYEIRRHGRLRTYALSDFRPLARRAFRILRPAFVAMRERKP